MMKPYVWLQTSDDSIQQVEQEIAMFCPLICQEIIQKGTGSSKNCAICLPQQVSPAMLSLILDYCRFHQVPGRSNKVLPVSSTHLLFSSSRLDDPCLSDDIKGYLTWESIFYIGTKVL